jgi:cytochrome oxidase Cu insertion factor (SCO1/SenC/PrrC family)
MKRKMIALSLAMGLVFCAVGNVLAEEGSKAKPEEKDMMPSFSLNTLDGKTIDNSSIKGKAAVFVLMQTACNLCRQEVDDMNQISRREDYKNINFYVVSVDINPDRVLPGYVKRYKIKMTMLKDPDFTFGSKHDISFTPATIFVGKDGKVKGVSKGYSQGSFAEIKKNLDMIK